MDYRPVNCTRVRYLFFLEQIVRENSTVGCKNYIFSKHGRERCNHVACQKISKTKLHGDYLLCTTHRKDFEPGHTKQNRIYEEYWVQILFQLHKLEQPSITQTKVAKQEQILPSKLEQSSSTQIKQEKIEQSSLSIVKKPDPYLVLVNKQTKPAITVTDIRGERDVRYSAIQKTLTLSVFYSKECTRVGCSKKKSLKEKFQNLFCMQHVHELHNLRAFKRMPMTLLEEIALRKQELKIRKDADQKHAFYVLLLEQQLCKK